MRGDSVRRLARVRCRIAPAYSEELSVKHATDHALDRLEPLLRRLRAVDGLRERKRGTFTHRSRAFLHFHEDPKGMFADISDPDERIDVTETAGREALMAAARRRLSA